MPVEGARGGTRVPGARLTLGGLALMLASVPAAALAGSPSGTPQTLLGDSGVDHLVHPVLVVWRLAALLLVLAGTWIMTDVRAAGRDRGSLLDVAIAVTLVAVACWAVAAVLDPSVSAESVVTSALAPAAAVAVVAIGAPLLARGRTKAGQPVQVWIALALAATTAAGAAAFAGRPGTADGRPEAWSVPATIALVLAVVAGAVAVKHAGLPDLLSDASRPRRAVGRGALLALGWLAGPLLVAVLDLTDAAMNSSPLVIGWVLMAVLGAVRLVDVSGQAASARAARDTSTRFRVAFDHALVGMALVAVDGPEAGRLVEVNASLCRVFGATPRDLVGRRLDQLVAGHADDVPDRRVEDRPFDGVLEAVRARGRVSLPAEVPLATADGRAAWGVVSVDLADAGMPRHAVVQVEDVTERRAARHQLTSQALQDPLTGLANWRLLHERLATALSRAHRTGSGLAVVRLDLDRFSAVNAVHGHDVGDVVLVETGARLRAVTRPGDTVARIAGDEFAVLLEDLASEEDAVAVADRMRLALDRPFEVDDARVAVSGSIGLAALAPGSSQTAETTDLLDRSTFALGRARRRRHGGLVVFDDDLAAAADARAGIADDLRRAVAVGGLRLVFQPIVALPGSGGTRPVVGWEALLRWDRDGAELRPRDFMDVAEESGLIVPIGQRGLEIALAALPLLDAACSQPPAAGTKAHADPLQYGDALRYVAVNLSPRQLAQRDLAARVARAADTAGVDPGRLCVDVPETALSHDSEHVHAVLRRLRTAGVRVALDDFGTGHTSLAHLRHVPADIIKLDRSLLGSLDRGAPGAAVVAGVIQMAAGLGLSVMAEGVESADEDAGLQRLGAHAAQGHFYGRPVPAPWPNGEPPFAPTLRGRPGARTPSGAGRG